MLESFKPRLYQERLYAKAARNNTLIVLPTGLGKTAIAVMLTEHRLENYPKSKILFLAPTKPLVQQHVKTFKELLPKHEDKVFMFTGSVKPEDRQKAWDEHQIFISTPQGMENDVISKRIQLKKVSLLIFDEAHKATGNYAYKYLAKNYVQNADYERILALTASPGSKSEVIEEVCNNLFIDKLEYRHTKSEDVKAYVQETKVNYVNVELPESFKRIQMFLQKSYVSKLKKCIDLQTVDKTVLNMSKTQLLKLMNKLHAKASRAGSDYKIYQTISLVAEALKVQHALELLESQGLQPLLEYFDKIDEQSKKGKVKAVKNLVKDFNFKSAKILTQKQVKEGVRHPKLPKTVEIVKEQLRVNKDSKVIIFTQYRDTGKAIKKALEKNDITSKMFFGQAKKKNTGLTQKEQKERIQNFKNNEFTCLISTSVGEEGLDIPEVSTVLFYEPIPSAIRTVQRRGRTGRQKKGNVITLIAKGTRDEGYRWSSHHKERRMYTHLEKLKGNISREKNTDLRKFQNKPAVSKNYKVSVDYREKGSLVMKELLKNGVNIDLQQLDVGDFALSKDLVIEYKTLKDFVDSIIDKRIIEQARNLSNVRKPVIIIEGEQNIYEQRRIHPNAIRGMITTLALNFNISMIRTKDYLDTTHYITLLAEREYNPKNDGWTAHSAKPVTQKEMQEYLVASLPGIGSKLAPHLLKEFETIENIINATEKDLKKVDLIGNKKAKNLKNLFEKKYDS